MARIMRLTELLKNVTKLTMWMEHFRIVLAFSNGCFMMYSFCPLCIKSEQKSSVQESSYVSTFFVVLIFLVLIQVIHLFSFGVDH